ncbi:hypothetical protein Pla108_19190 [Botrimarina colliarenosi]|uniref:Type VI secretion protein n=1 Tax=Botrimarina colliarenosi TaxID=2528001 RepID=A0A5C6AED0_9BACT|nr:type VI secretion system baseplate subunit TssK [Botrimarina colliarenosi]TWT97767.1 hypothetical protein Pla108_19190 [Botrimarina colliarenosi]
MSDLPIHWHEGMFLTPQHFQAADRWQDRARALGARWDHHYNWGVRSIEIDADALANHRLVIRSLEARLPDGSSLAFPEDGVLPVLDLREGLRRDATVRVELALPLENPVRPSVTDTPTDVAARHLVEIRESADHNTGNNPQSIQVLRPNARLLTSDQEAAGYQTLPLLQVRRSDSASGCPEIDAEYIPPLLACDAWAPLQVGVVLRLLERLEKKATVLANQAASRGLDFDSAGQGERLLLEQLRTLNEGIAVLSIDAAAQGVAPLVVYRELARITGRLSAFTREMKYRALPAYDHDDLAGCFLAARREIESLLSAVIEPSYQERPFVPEKSLLRVELDPSWIEAGQRLYVGVQTSLSEDETEHLLASGNHVKFGSALRAEDLFLLGETGLAPRKVIHPPRALPLRRGMAYYELATDSSPTEWREVERTLSLAARLGEHMLVDSLGDRNEVVVRYEGKTTTLRMSLFAVRQAASTADTPVTANALATV